MGNENLYRTPPLVLPANVDAACVLMAVSKGTGNVVLGANGVQLIDDAPRPKATPQAQVIGTACSSQIVAPGDACVLMLPAANVAAFVSHPVHCEFNMDPKSGKKRGSLIFLGPPDTPGPGTPAVPTPGPGTPTPAKQLRAVMPFHREK